MNCSFFFLKFILSFKWKIATSPRRFSSISNSDSLVFINAEIYISTVLMFALMETCTKDLAVFVPF